MDDDGWGQQQEAEDEYQQQLEEDGWGVPEDTKKINMTEEQITSMGTEIPNLLKNTSSLGMDGNLTKAFKIFTLK